MNYRFVPAQGGMHLLVYGPENLTEAKGGQGSCAFVIRKPFWESEEEKAMFLEFLNGERR